MQTSFIAFRQIAAQAGIGRLRSTMLFQNQKNLTQIEMDLAEHVKYPPERGAKARVIQDYIEKENYLQFEVII